MVFFRLVFVCLVRMFFGGCSQSDIFTYICRQCSCCMNIVLIWYIIFSYMFAFPGTNATTAQNQKMMRCSETKKPPHIAVGDTQRTAASLSRFIITLCKIRLLYTLNMLLYMLSCWVFWTHVHHKCEYTTTRSATTRAACNLPFVRSVWLLSSCLCRIVCPRP